MRSGPGRGGGAEAQQGGWVQHGTDGGRNWCLRAVGPWRLLDRRPGHKGRCRAILRPAGFRVDPAWVGSLPKPPPPTPWGQGLSFLPKALLAPTAPPCPPVWAPSWAPPHHPSSPFHLESLLLDSQHPRPSAPCTSVTLLTSCHAVWLRRCPLVFRLDLGLWPVCVCACVCTPICACLCTCICTFSSLACHWSRPQGLRAPKEKALDSPSSPQDHAVNLPLGTGSCVACWPGWGSRGGPGAALRLPRGPST